MDHVTYFKDIFESKPEYRKIVLLMFLIKKDVDLLIECGFLNINRLCLDFENFLLEQNEDYLDSIKKNETESIVERFLDKKRENDINHQSLEIKNCLME